MGILAVLLCLFLTDIGYHDDVNNDEKVNMIIMTVTEMKIDVGSPSWLLVT